MHAGGTRPGIQVCSAGRLSGSLNALYGRGSIGSIVVVKTSSKKYSVKRISVLAL